MKQPAKKEEPEERFNGEHIATMRRKRELTQGELAGLINIHPVHMSYIETGAKTPGLDTMFRIAEALDCPVSDLLPDSQWTLPSGRRIFVSSSKPRLTRFTSIEERSTNEDDRDSARSVRVGGGGVRTARQNDDKGDKDQERRRSGR